MKKLSFLLLLMITAVLVLAACGNKDKENETNHEGKTSSALSG